MAASFAGLSSRATTAFGLAVGYIIGIGSKEEVVWVHAKPNIAGVTYAHTVSLFTPMDFVGHTVGLKSFTLPARFPDCPISLATWRTGP